jgi:hypothetical protein
MSPRVPVRPAATAGVLLLTALLSGCGSSTTSNTAALSTAPPPQADSASFSAAAPAAAPALPKAKQRIPRAPSDARPAALGVPDSALTGRSIVHTAEETVEVPDIDRAVSAVEAAVDATGGLVARSERSGGDTPSANLRLRVPPSSFESFLDRIGKLGTVSDRTLTGEDVTDQVVDVAARVQTQRASVDRVRALMNSATSLKDVVTLEGELSAREADLEALLAKQNKLKDQTDLATVTVHLVTPGHAAAAAAHHRRGFAAGLGNGWAAFTAAAVGAATVLGAVLPFAVAIAVLAPPLARAAFRLRRSRRSRTVG